jgi:hypothetical protein
LSQSACGHIKEIAKKGWERPGRCRVFLSPRYRR